MNEALRTSLTVIRPAPPWKGKQAPAAPVVLEPPVEASGYETATPLVDGTAPTQGTSTSGTDAVVEGAAVEHAPEAP